MSVLRDRRGAVAALGAIVMIGVVGFAGLAIDVTRVWMVNARLKTAIDAASLVGARQITQTVATRDAMIENVYWANYTQNGRSTNYLQATAGRPVINQINDQQIQVTGSAVVPTTLFNIIGSRNTTITDSAVARRQGTGLELALVLDVTGSMASNNNIGALRTSATDLVNILFGGEEEQANLWVSIVPYTAMVNIGAGRANWLQPGSLEAVDYRPSEWLGCVEARAGTNYPTGADEDDSPPSDARFRPHFWPSSRFEPSYDRNAAGEIQRDASNNPYVWVYRGVGNPPPRTSPVVRVALPFVLPTDRPVNQGDNAWIPGGTGLVRNGTAVWSDAVWEPDQANPGTDAQDNARDNNGRGPNLGCGRAVLPLTRQRSTLITQIDALRATRRGGTMANLGLQLGWGTISPRWRADWNLAETHEGNQLPLDYNTRFMRKAIVLMTDGENQWYDWPDGAPGQCTTAQNGTPGPCVFVPATPTPLAVGTLANPTGVPVATGWRNPTATSVRPWTVNPQVPVRYDADQNAYGRLTSDGLNPNRIGILNPTPGAGGTAVTDATNGINARMTRLCNAVRSDNRNITVYTIVFVANASETVQNLYRNCASSPDNFFLAPTQAALQTAFQTIAGQLANLQLLQ
jgi:Flp pilus assembly protein TadG